MNLDVKRHEVVTKKVNTQQENYTRIKKNILSFLLFDVYNYRKRCSYEINDDIVKYIGESGHTSISKSEYRVFEIEDPIIKSNNLNVYLMKMTRQW